MAIFINPFVDRGFKIIFGKEDSKVLLIDLLNDLFEGEHVITDLSYGGVCNRIGLLALYVEIYGKVGNTAFQRPESPLRTARKIGEDRQPQQKRT